MDFCPDELKIGKGHYIDSSILTKSITFIFPISHNSSIYMQNVPSLLPHRSWLKLMPVEKDSFALTGTTEISFSERNKI